MCWNHFLSTNSRTSWSVCRHGEVGTIVSVQINKHELTDVSDNLICSRGTDVAEGYAVVCPSASISTFPVQKEEDYLY